MATSNTSLRKQDTELNNQKKELSTRTIELKSKNEELKDKNVELRKENAELEAQVDSLKKELVVFESKCVAAKVEAEFTLKQIKFTSIDATLHARVELMEEYMFG